MLIILFRKYKNKLSFSLSLFLITIFSIVVIAIDVYAIPNPNVTNVATSPTYIDIDQETNISAEVRQSNYSIDEVNAEITYPNTTIINYSMTIDSDFITETGIGAEPYNLTAPSYNISINCYDFTDGSECNVNAS